MWRRLFAPSPCWNPSSVLEMDAELAADLIKDQTLNKLNRIKKISLEAFFYCCQLEQLQ